MTGLRTITGKEGTNFWQERYGVKAGESPCVARVSRFRFTASGNEHIDASLSMTSNNVLIHSIRAVNTHNDDDIAVGIYSGSSGTTSIFKAIVNRQHKKGPEVEFNFPIPMLSVGGGRIYADAGDIIISVCYTILESITDIDPDKDIFLQSQYYNSQTLASIVTDRDCEIVGVYVNNTSENNTNDFWGEIQIRNLDAAGASASVIAQVSTNENCDVDETGHSNFSQLPGFHPMWFSYPVYARKGFQLDNVGTGAANIQATVFYRKVNAYDIDHGWI